MFGHGQRIRGVALHAQVQRFDALEEQERIEGRKRRAGVTQSLHARLEDEGQRPEGLGVTQAVVGGIGLGKFLEAARCRPVELSGVHDHAANGRAVPPRNLVAEFTTMSAPHSIGRTSAGEPTCCR